MFFTCNSLDQMSSDDDISSDSDSEDIIVLFSSQYTEMNDPDYKVCFEGDDRLPIYVYRLIYALQTSTLKLKKYNDDKTVTLQFTLPPAYHEYLTNTLLWEIKKSTYISNNNIISVIVPEESLIIQGLDHHNPSFPPKVFDYLEIRSKKESVDVQIGR